ncbi:HAMP domain-containing histidine kinase [Candidatus Saccharibacteria bacterium]|nr:HAMP domain-containing histidine kinase [Candidatus Saccharibacteria bacterium]
MNMEVDGAALVAHELKAPWALVRQLAFALPEMEADGEHLKSEMVQVSERALRQINDYLKVQRLEDGLFEMEPVAVRAVCNDVTEELTRLFAAKKRGLTVKYLNRAKLVNANPELLFSVVYNFLVNAVRYSGEGTETELTVKDHAGKVKVIVRDYGPALPVTIWRELRQGGVKQPMKVAMRPGSSGMGLYIASRFAQYMRADVGAVRHRDGASFYVEIPASRQASLFYDICD